MTEDDIIRIAREKSGLTDFGDPEILEGLRVLLKSYASEGKFTEAGLARNLNSLSDYLANRMRVEDWIAKHPEVLERPVEKPMFVFGLPRTGTTLTINLLHADPARRSMLRWEAFDSVPPPKPEELRAGPRYEAEQAKINMSLKYAPHISAVHHEDADSPCECQFAMTPSFCAQVYDSNADLPTYRQWFYNEASYLPAFRYQKRLLQVLQSEAPGRWTLKNPWHPLFLNDLTTVFPDAQLVMTHRDPADVVGSACSLIKVVRQLFSDDVDLHRIGQTMVETFQLMIERQNAFRAKHGENSIYDIQYEEQLRDPVGQMKKLYDHFDEPFTPVVEESMKGFLANNPKNKFGKHEYTLEEYGLNAAEIHEQFGDYISKFNIPTKQTA